MQHGPFTVTDSKDIYKNPWISVREDQVTHSGNKTGRFGVVTMLPGSTVLPVDEEQSVYLIREYRYAINQNSLEAVSGGIDPGESPLEAAQRELNEELGLEAATWHELGKIDPFTMIIDSPNYLFLATDLRPSATGRTDETPEYIETVRMPLKEAVQLVQDGEITHGASCAVILKAARLLGVQ